MIMSNKLYQIGKTFWHAFKMKVPEMNVLIFPIHIKVNPPMWVTKMTVVLKQQFVKDFWNILRQLKTISNVFSASG